jgi:hypothetical protein
MPAALLPTLFWICAITIVVAQVFILRSTARAWHAAGTRAPFVEKVFAWGPALVLVAVLWFAWCATVQPPTVSLDPRPAAGSVQL